MKKLIASLAVIGGVTAGAIAIASPAWAVCAYGADAPNSLNQSFGSRTGCSGTVTLEIRFAKEVSFAPDPYYYYKQDDFGNGTLGAQGHCGYGPGAYYTWTVSSDGNEIESGRVGRC